MWFFVFFEAHFCMQIRQMVGFYRFNRMLDDKSVINIVLDYQDQ